jgi:hypothetical protein
LDSLPPNTQRRVHAGTVQVSKEKQWDVKTIMRLNRIIEEIKLDEKYNPWGLELPRAAPTLEGLPGAPWLWHPEPMFQDHSWEFLQLEFEDRLRRMDRGCDWAHDHDSESAETLFLACVILWFQSDGGKDEILSYSHDYLRPSCSEVFNRPRFACSTRFNHSYRLEREVSMRSRSRFGIPCSNVTNHLIRHPESLSDYDDSRRTITMETWVMNRGKKDCKKHTSGESLASLTERSPDSVEKESVAEWTNYLRGVPRVTEFYDITALLEQTLDAIGLPSKWTRAAEDE